MTHHIGGVTGMIGSCCWRQQNKGREGKAVSDWPKKETIWHDGDTMYVSVPFTWRLPAVMGMLKQRGMFHKRAVVGGPAVKLMPDYLQDIDGVTVDTGDMPGVLQLVNPQATRTTAGCPNRCGFCAVPTIEGDFRELEDWPDLPVICDNNLLAATTRHFNRVCDRLEEWGWADFNQGLDCRLLTAFHAERLKRIGKAMCRLALDHKGQMDAWEDAFGMLTAAGVPKCRIRSYVLAGFRSDPQDAWERCRCVEAHGVTALPQWYHSLGQLEPNSVTEDQQKRGWDHGERLRLMRWYYKHSGEPLTE